MVQRFQGERIKPKTLFRLLLKLLGVWLFTLGIGSLAQSIISVIAISQMISGTSNPYYRQELPRLVQPLIETAMGLYLFFGGEWVVQRVTPDNRRRCPECQYDLSHASSSVCPECGTALATVGSETA